MMLKVSDLLRIGGLPETVVGVRKWLQRNEIPLTQDGKRFTFHLSDLPEPVRLAYQVRQAERSGLAAGVQDDAAHLALMAKPMGTQKRAHERQGRTREVLGRAVFVKVFPKAPKGKLQ